METIRNILSNAVVAGDLSAGDRAAVAGELAGATGLKVYETSVALAAVGAPPGARLLALARDGRTKRLLVAARPGSLGVFAKMTTQRRAIQVRDDRLEVAIIDTTHAAADALRQALPWTAPRLGGLTRSVGLGDRLGLATPGHVLAVHGSGCFPFFAQQSIREMTRTQRTAQQVMDDATWGVFQAGWREGFGSDADHLKNPADIDTCVAAGFTMFTIDPGDHVRSDADEMDDNRLSSEMQAMDWKTLEISAADFRSAYAGRSFTLDGGTSLSIDDRALARSAVKYGRAIAHTTRMFRHLCSVKGTQPFELEVSVDETATPTTTAEHYLIAAELKRLGVTWVSLAPRFVGQFEKAIDYQGDLPTFERTYAQHVAIARTLGPYKLSLHSGSDKFSVYPIAARLSGELVHLKTAGTSYLEALRVVARRHPALFRRILDFAFTRFEDDRKTYHLSARLESVPRAARLADSQLESVLDGNDGRQLLHVTFGSVLTARQDDGTYRFRDDLHDLLINHEEEHYAVLQQHLGRHVRPFAR